VTSGVNNLYKAGFITVAQLDNVRKNYIQEKEADIACHYRGGGVPRSSLHRAAIVAGGMPSHVTGASAYRSSKKGGNVVRARSEEGAVNRMVRRRERPVIMTVIASAGCKQ